MLDAVKKIPMKAKITASGSAPPASGDPKGIDAAIAAPGAIEQIDWNTTSRNPTAFFSSCATYFLRFRVYCIVVRQESIRIPRYFSIT
jgi:hypothetical protein